ncbi:MAG: ABC transporter substrate-binding protein [Chloroflexi bacterium]|nr:ABC transporter substrate-binding protein [Chloroflexota bacterium]
MRFAFCVLSLAATLGLVACSLPGDAAPVVKIGLIAPFEGVGRPFGYGILPAVKAAIAEANASGQLGRYRVALVALNDDLDPRAAAAQAQALTQDADVVAVLGPWESATAQAAAPILAQAGIPTLVGAPLTGPLSGVTSLCPSPQQITVAFDTKIRVVNTLSVADDATMAANELIRSYAQNQTGALAGGPDLFRPWLIGRAGAAAEGTLAAACAPAGMAVPGGAGQGADASLAHAAALADYGTRVLLQAVAADIVAHGQPSRAGVAAALSQQPMTSEVIWYRVQNGQWVLDGD